MPATTATAPSQAPEPLEAVPAKPKHKIGQLTTSELARERSRQEEGSRIAVLRACECGMATDDPGLLEDHLGQYGHRERVPWWDTFTRVILASW